MAETFQISDRDVGFFLAGMKYAAQVAEEQKPGAKLRTVKAIQREWGRLAMDRELGLKTGALS